MYQHEAQTMSGLGRGGLVATKEERPRPPLAGELQELAMAVSTLRNQTESLIDSLSPVLGADETKSPGPATTTESGPVSPICAQVRDQRYQVQAVSSLLAALRYRLAI
jgi:hypothetical protein